MPGTRKLGRPTDHRKAMLRGMVTYLLENGQIERMVTMCGASLPRKFTKLVQRFEDQPEALRDAGIAYAIEQIVDLITDGVDGIHVYTMNNFYVARKITEAVSGILRAAPIC